MIERVRRERTRAKAKGPSERRPIIYACLSARAPRTTHSVLDKRERETHDDDVSRNFVHFRPLKRLPWRIRERMNRMLNGIRIILLTLLLQRDFSTMISVRRGRRGILYREPAPTHAAFTFYTPRRRRKLISTTIFPFDYLFTRKN